VAIGLRAGHVLLKTGVHEFGWARDFRRENRAGERTGVNGNLRRNKRVFRDNPPCKKVLRKSGYRSQYGQRYSGYTALK
jgi:hypothetical protein